MNLTMHWFSLLISHLIIMDIAFALTLADNKADLKENQLNGSTVTETVMATTPAIQKTTVDESIKKESVLKGEKRQEPEVDTKEEGTVEKPLPKKRGVLQDLYYKQPLNFEENAYNVNEEQIPQQFFTKPELEENSYNAINGYGNLGFINDEGYFDNEDRRKRTALLDGIYGSREYAKPEIELTPDEVIALLSLLEERRFNNNPSQSRWSDYDNAVDSIEKDMRDENVERTDNQYDDVFDGNYETASRYPTSMKRYMITRRKKNYLGNPKLKIPVFRRAIL